MSNYISYAWCTSNRSGFGGIDIFAPENIKSIQDVQDINKWLSDEVVKDIYGEKAKCVVISFQKYQKEGEKVSFCYTFEWWHLLITPIIWLLTIVFLYGLARNIRW